MSITVSMNGISRHFGERSALQEISATAIPGKVLVVTGPNGSGKSTMLKIAAGLLRPSSGSVLYGDGTTQGPAASFSDKIGFVSPELMLYDELSAIENLTFFGGLKGVIDVEAKAESLLKKVGLLDRADDAVSGYSSGMKQRLKYCFALIGDPEVLIIDEPTANLDEPGKLLAYSIISEARKSLTVILATNEKEEVPLGDEIILLNP